MPAKTPTESPADDKAADEAASAGAESPTEKTGAGRSWWPAVRTGVAVWSASYLAWAVVTLFTQFGRPPGKPVGVVDLIRTSWWQYDAKIFTRIAQDGYATNPVDPAFFPLYPMLVRAADLVLPLGPKFTPVFVAAAAMLAMYVLLYRLAEVEFGRFVAIRASWALAAWPVAFFLGIGYNESLFIALMIGAIYAMRRGHWWVAGVIGGLASATRSVGLVMAVAFAYEYLRQHGFRWRWNVLAIALVPSGLIAYMGYLWWRLGDPLIFMSAQAPWGRELSAPWTGFVKVAKVLTTQPLAENSTLHNLFDLITVLAMIVLLTLCFVGPWKMRRDQWVMPLLGVALLLFTISFPAGAHRNQALMSAPRFALEIFPAFLLLGHLKQLPVQIYAVVALMLQGVMLAHMSGGGWVG